jgi:hypothetical protein
MIEHIVVGDSCPLLAQWMPELQRKFPPLRIINLPPDQGSQDYVPARIARVRNAGIALARGTLIAHLDDDNVFRPDHVASLVKILAEQPVAAFAHSFRELLIDGDTPFTRPIHPWSRSIEEGQKVWHAYRRMGIYEEGSHLMRDRITFHEERDCTVDTNELLVRKEIHLKIPFVEKFSPEMVAEELGEDDVFCEQVYRAGYRTICSALPTLAFRIGGRFTALVAPATCEEA